MEFIDTYKRLDNLCKDIFKNNAGVTSYITEMEHCYGYTSRIEDWESDYKKLKHYRYIRNQIVHENWASETALCNIDDTYWLEEFYQRILNQTDPISQYHQLVNSYKQRNQKCTTQNKQSTEQKKMQSSTLAQEQQNITLKQTESSTLIQKQKNTQDSFWTRVRRKISHVFDHS